MVFKLRLLKQEGLDLRYPGITNKCLTLTRTWIYKFLYMQSFHNRVLLIISVLHLRSRVGDGIAALKTPLSGYLAPASLWNIALGAKADIASHPEDPTRSGQDEHVFKQQVRVFESEE